MMMASGMDKVFEIGQIFRAEEHDTLRHLNEAVSIDAEASFADDEDVMKILNDMIINVLKDVNENCADELEILGHELEVPTGDFPVVTYDEAVDIVNLWVRKGLTIVENRGKLKQANREYKTRVEPVDTLMPLAVLVNGETASASEITSGSLQDLDRAIVIGTRTYGKGLVQVPLDMPYNTNLKVTTSKYYIPSGRCIQAVNYKRNGTGGYLERVPDSLTHVFYTAAGREVRDGGGIKPDVEVKNDTIPNIAYYLSATGRDSTEVMFDWIVKYIAKHPTIAPAADFRLTDEDFADFKQQVISSGFTYDPVSEKQLKELVKTAKAEGYYEQAREAFELLESKLKHDVATDLDKYNEILRQMLELEIITAYYYQAGAIKAGLRNDPQLKEAIRLLQAPEEYKKLLTPKKTA
jgi:carboxyl-terminal processing protease